jgi:hypothetical protein
VNGTIGTKGGQDCRVKGDAKVILQPGDNAHSVSAKVGNEVPIVLHMTQIVVNPFWARGLATSITLGWLHVVSDSGQSRGAPSSRLG